MERVLLNISLILILVYFYKITRHGLHILQLENYYIDRYAVWMKRYIKKVLNIKTIILLLIPIILFVINTEISINIAFAVEIFGLLYLIISTKREKEKKAFVVTARIKRIYTTYLIFFVVVAICSNLFDYKIVLSIVNVCAMVAYTFVYIISLINKPVEKSIRRGFCKRAQKKLQDIPDLKVIGITGSYGKTSTKYK